MTNSAFADIEQALMGAPYTVFNGHVHAYDYEQAIWYGLYSASNHGWCPVFLRWALSRTISR